MTIKVLLVDSRGSKERRAAADALEDHGFAVLVASSTDEAREFMKTDTVKVALIDALGLVCEPRFAKELRKQGVVVAAFGPQSDDLSLPVAALAMPLYREQAKIAIESMAGKEPPPSAEGVAVQHEIKAGAGGLESGAALALLVRLSRAKVTGELALVSDRVVYTLSLTEGVVVGARGGGNEHRLLNMLIDIGAIDEAKAKLALKHAEENQLRVAEALLAIGACSAAELVAALRAQVVRRTQAALSLAKGGYTYTPVARDEDLRQSSRVDIYTIAPAVAEANAHRAVVTDWLTANRARPLRRTAELDAALNARRDLEVQGLSRALFEASSPAGVVALVRASAGEVEAQRAAARLWALHVIGAIALGADPDPPGLARVAAGDIAQVSAPVERVLEVWVRAQGRTLFHLLGVEASASRMEIELAYAKAKGTFGRQALASAQLGIAQDAAETLWFMLDEIENTLLDDGERERYRKEIAFLDAPQTSKGLVPEVEAEGHLRVAKVLRAAGDNSGALRELTSATENASDDEIIWLLEWTRFQASPTPESRELAREAVLNLAREAAAHGDTKSAHAYVEEAGRVFAYDPALTKLRSELGIASASVVNLMDEAGFQPE